MKNLIIIHHEPLTKKVKRNFFIDELISKGIYVYYFDIHRILFSRIKYIDELFPDYCIHIYSLKQLRELIYTHRKALFITEFNITLKSYWILYYLKKYNCQVSTLGIHTSINLSLKEKLLNIHNYGFNKIKPFIISFFNNLSIFFLKLFYPIKDIDIAFYCGNSSFRKFKNIPIKIPINSFDFEDFKKIESKISISDYNEGKYVVFLDQYLPYHPDISIWGKQSIKPNVYFECLNNLFDQIEKQLELKIVIALHPKADYSDIVYRDRPTYKYRTAELIRDCEFVIAHDSLSISYAILNNKPLLFVYISDFYKMGTTIMVLLKKYSRILGCQLVNISKKNKIEKIPRYNSNGYLIYKYNYLTNKECENELNVDILYNFIKRISIND